jgi:hypothetical protein
MPRRRDVLAGLLATGALPALSPLFGSASALADQGGAAASQADPKSVKFWADFLGKTTTPLATVPEGRTRGTIIGADREPFFFHAHEAEHVVQPAAEIQMSKLLPEGDVTVSLNLARFKPAKDDALKITAAQNAQLRLDVLQNSSIIELLDQMAWTVILLAQPKRQDKLPPIQSLAFDSNASWQKMQNIILPKGQGSWALNFYVEKADNAFVRALKTAIKESDRWSQFFSFPGLIVKGLQSFNEIYGWFHTRPEAIYQSNPVPVYATQQALSQGTSGTSRALPLHTGTYMVVPNSQCHLMTPSKLSGLELLQGYVVPNKTDLARVFNVVNSPDDPLPDVSYLTFDVTVKPLSVACKK